MLTLQAEPRAVFGKKLETLRKEGKLPIVAYGPKDASRPLVVNAFAFKKAWRSAGESSVVSLVVGSEEKDVLIHDVQVHPISGEPLHADLYMIESGKSIQVKVPLEFVGVSPAVKSLGGVLVKVLHEIEIEAMPRSLPHELKVDISSLQGFADKITVADLRLPAGVTTLANTEEIVALVSEPREEVVETASPTIADIEVVGAKGKKDEEREGATTTESSTKEAVKN